MAEHDKLLDLPATAAERRRLGDIDAVSEATRHSWQLKRTLASGVCNDQVDAAVEAPLNAGASGPKVTAAGGGGILPLICPGEHQQAVR